MRILHATDTYAPTIGGIEVLVRTLAESQAAMGHEVTVLTRTPEGHRPDHLPQDIEVLRDPRSLASLVARADVVHGHVSAFSPLALRAVEGAARAGIPSVATVHSVWGGAWPLFRATAALRGWTSLPIQWAAVSEVAAGPVQRALGGRDVLVIPNAVDVDYWAPTRPARHPKVVTMVAVMRMAGRKRPLELVSTLHRVRAQVPDDVTVDVQLVGDGPLLHAVRRGLAQRGMTDWVHTPGDISHRELRHLYRRAEIFIAPATLESFGLAALEARAAGLAVVARTATGVTEFIAHDVDGLLADSDTAMSEQLARLCTDATTRRRIVGHNHLTRPTLDWSYVRELNTAAYAQAGAVDHRATATEPRSAA
ncbi:galactosyltransferase or lps biosynthesis RfbU-related protein [Janibacter sp. HTCC2649]|uniref:glycosyltransferase family 4 protein n=1 Tax=Janibacter sp. HTCC2649 TaxID=313589 RepID=UPI0000670CE9|nr:glycosyltransferase family 4 protein [Janibacter sp. HTCC2649]EAQ00075.1 galactosyltransferase or lps biosynthesis RfbU-related protein [Janibacter sp. HTCC2649]